MSACYRAMESVGGYYRISQAGMSALVKEMVAQGIFDRAPDVRVKLEQQHGAVTPAEILALIEQVDLCPSELPKPVVTVVDRTMAQAAQAALGERFRVRRRCCCRDADVSAGLDAGVDPLAHIHR